jgi:serine/threonine protein kinase
MGIEFAKNGTLLQQCRKTRKNAIDDIHASQIIKSILQGLQHLHRNNYVHRDLKPSNVVFDDEIDFSKVKLVDFGLAVKYHTTQSMDETCGTLVY